MSQITWMPASRKASAAGAVHVVGRDDGDGLDAVRARRFGLRPSRVVGIDAVRGQAERGAGAPRLLGIGRQRAGDQLVVVVEARGDAVHGADEGALAAADHAQPDAPAGASAVLRFDRHGRLRQQAQHAPGRFGRLPPAKSSKAFSVTRMMWSRDEWRAFGAPSSGCLRQHSHSSTAQPS